MACVAFGFGGFRGFFGFWLWWLSWLLWLLAFGGFSLLVAFDDWFSVAFLPLRGFGWLLLAFRVFIH